MSLTDIYMRMFGTTQLWGIDLGFYFTMLIVVLIVIAQNIVFWSMKGRPSSGDAFLFALRNDSDLGTVERIFENSSERSSLLKNADRYLEEALKNQTHDEVFRFLLRNFEFSESVTSDRRIMLIALENSNPSITRLFLDNFKR